MVLSFLALLACSDGKVTIGEDVVNGEVLEGNPNSDDTATTDDSATTDTASGDTATSDTGATDTGSGSTDTGTNDTGGGSTNTGAPEQGAYSGTIQGEIDFGRGGAVGCEGDVTFTVDANGVIDGYALCDISEWRFAVEGALTGSVSRGSVDGLWTVDLRGYPVEVAMTGDIQRGNATLELGASFDWFSFAGRIEAGR